MNTYSPLNLIINEFNFIGSQRYVINIFVRKIISLLPHGKYADIMIILHNMEGLSTMTPILVTSKLVSFEMSYKMD